MLSTIVSIQPKDSGGSGGETRETVVYRQADEMLSKLPPDYIPHEVKIVKPQTAAFYCNI
jgi:dynein heavy chain